MLEERHSLRKYLIIIIVIISFNSLFAQAKRSIGILPFENNSKNKYDWVGFGIEYLLSTKLANISSYYVPGKKTILDALKKREALGAKKTSEVIYQVGRETGINVAIVGEYKCDGTSLVFDVQFVNAFSGSVILTKNYNNKLSELFDVADDVIKNLIEVTAISLTSQEEIIISRRMTKSIDAFESFCLAYIENEKANGKTEIVTSLFRRAITADNSFWEAYYNLGIAYYNEKKYDNALSQFSIIIDALPNFEKPYFGRGMIYLEKKKYEEAKDDFTKVVDSNPNDYKGYFYLGKIAAAQKNFSKANKLFDKATSINPEDPEIYFDMGNIWFEQNNYQNAIPPYKKCIELNPENHKARQNLGECYYRNQVYYSAISEFETILAAIPDEPLANFMLGITVYKQAVLNDLIEAFLELLEPDPTKKNKNVTSSEASKAELYYKMVACFDNAQKARPNFLEATFNLALTYHEMAQYDKALEFYKKTISIDPTLVKAHIKTAHCLEAIGKKDEALQKYKEVIEIDPAYFVAHPTLGPIHQYINIMDMMLNELDEKLKENPDDLRANQILAKIYYAQGYFGKAANVFRKVLKINPKDQEAKRMLAKLDGSK